MCALFLSGGVSGVLAGEASVKNVQILKSDDGSLRFSVTIAHADEGWDHYADSFEIVAPDGTVLSTRTLFHPHVDEQPFTRSLDNVFLPKELDSVEVRAHDTIHGYGTLFPVTIPAY